MEIEVVGQADVAPRQRVLATQQEAIAAVLEVAAASGVVVVLEAALDEVPIPLEAHEVDEPDQVVDGILELLVRRVRQMAVVLAFHTRLEVREVPGALHEGQVGRGRVSIDQLVVAQRQVVVGEVDARLRRQIEQRAAPGEAHAGGVVVDVERPEGVVVRAEEREAGRASPRLQAQPVVLRADREELAERPPVVLARELHRQVVRLLVRLRRRVVVEEAAQLDLGPEPAGVLVRRGPVHRDGGRVERRHPVDDPVREHAAHPAAGQDAQRVQAGRDEVAVQFGRGAEQRPDVGGERLRAAEERPHPDVGQRRYRHGPGGRSLQ